MAAQHVQLITLSQAHGNIEQFVQMFNDFCSAADISIDRVRIEEEYEFPEDPYDPEIRSGQACVDVLHDILCEVWYREADGLPPERQRHARLFVSEYFRDHLEFFHAVNDFCARAHIAATARAASPYNQSFIAVYLGRDPLVGDKEDPAEAAEPPPKKKIPKNKRR